MSNDTGINHKLKVKILNHVSGLQGKITKPRFKFVCEMTYGILSSKSVLLSSIGRSLKEPLNLHQTEKRLSRQIQSEGLWKEIESYNIGIASRYLHDGMAAAVDLGDLAKPSGNCFERLATVRDGDKGDYKPGYHLLKIVARDYERVNNIPLLSRLFSVEEDGFVSENQEIIESIDAVAEQSGGDLLYLIDRGGDRRKIILPLLEKKRRFLLRLANKRHLLWRGEALYPQEIVKKMNLRYRETLPRTEEWKNPLKVKYGITTVRLADCPELKLKLIAVKGFGKEPMVLLTTENLRGKRQVLKAIRQYLDRWAVEEAYRFEKEGLGLESIRVRSLTGFRNIVSLVNLAFSFIAIELIEKGGEVTEAVRAKAKRLKPKKRIRFHFYTLLNGISAYLGQAKEGLYKILRGKHSPPETPQLSLKLETTGIIP